MSLVRFISRYPKLYIQLCLTKLLLIIKHAVDSLAFSKYVVIFSGTYKISFLLSITLKLFV